MNLSRYWFLFLGLFQVSDGATWHLRHPTPYPSLPLSRDLYLADYIQVSNGKFVFNLLEIESRPVGQPSRGDDKVSWHLTIRKASKRQRSNSNYSFIHWLSHINQKLRWWPSQRTKCAKKDHFTSAWVLLESSDRRPSVQLYQMTTSPVQLSPEMIYQATSYLGWDEWLDYLD